MIAKAAVPPILRGTGLPAPLKAPLTWGKAGAG